jgi:hypothetical protein
MKSEKWGRNGTEGAYVHVALSVVVEAEQHQALPSAFADAPESPKSALPALNFPRNFSVFFADLHHNPALC